MKIDKNAIDPQFTSDEVADLVEMIHEWRLNRATIKRLKPVHEQIKALPKGNKIRKTIVIDKSIGKQLDDYCRTERVNKSDIIHLALLDFFYTN